MEKKQTKKPKRITRKEVTGRRRAPQKTACRALILLDTKKIRAEYLKIYKRNKKRLEKLEADLVTFHECDQPEFQKFMAIHFGAEQSRQHELSEQMHNARNRYQTICFLAKEKRLRPKQFCVLIENKVTPELDFWAVLDNEVNKFREQQEQQHASAENDDDFEDDDEDFGEYNDSGNKHKDFRKIFDGFFESMFGDYLPLNEHMSEADGKSLKRLYRELCLRYHPDKSGTHDIKTKRLWISIQEAYHQKDLAQLRAIHAGIEINSGKTELAISDIQTINEEILSTIQDTQYELRGKKRNTCWQFSKWDSKKRKVLKKNIEKELHDELKSLEWMLKKAEKQLTLVREPEKPKPEPKSRKQVLWAEAAKNTPDLFAMDF